MDTADIYTTTPVLGPNGREVELVELQDPKLLILPQNVVPLSREDSMTEQMRETLQKVQDKLTTEELKQMNLRNSGPEKANSLRIARDWLKNNEVSAEN